MADEPVTTKEEHSLSGEHGTLEGLDNPHNARLSASANRQDAYDNQAPIKQQYNSSTGLPKSTRNQLSINDTAQQPSTLPIYPSERKEKSEASMSKCDDHWHRVLRSFTDRSPSTKPRAFTASSKSVFKKPDRNPYPPVAFRNQNSSGQAFQNRIRIFQGVERTSKIPFSVEEDQYIEGLVWSTKGNIDWAYITNRLNDRFGTSRTRVAVGQHYRRVILNRKREQLSVEEAKKLLECVKEVDNRVKVTEKLRDRSDSKCRSEYRKLKQNLAIPWSERDLACLRECIRLSQETHKEIRLDFIVQNLELETSRTLFGVLHKIESLSKAGKLGEVVYDENELAHAMITGRNKDYCKRK